MTCLGVLWPIVLKRGDAGERGDAEENAEARKKRGDAEGRRSRIERTGMPRIFEDELTERIIAAAIHVHQTLGAGLLESAYEECFAVELSVREIPFVRQRPLEVIYRDTRLSTRAYRLDFVVDSAVVIEIKAQERLIPLHRAQLLTYLRLGGYSRGLLLNFGAARMADGIKRVVSGWKG
jgi:GxxExxY protein